jgi:hypothetical protein
MKGGTVSEYLSSYYIVMQDIGSILYWGDTGISVMINLCGTEVSFYIRENGVKDGDANVIVTYS